MKYLNVSAIVATAVMSCGCGAVPTTQPEVPDAADHARNASPHKAMLLVSLDDGSVVMQQIQSHADVCFKVNSQSMTTCLAQGAPVLEPGTNAVIGYEMIEMQIDLFAKTD